MKYYYIHFFLWSFLCSFALVAQNTPQPSYILNTNLSGNGVKQFVARDQVLLQPGFEFTPQSGSSFTAQVNPGLLFPPTGGTYMTPDGEITDNPQMGVTVGSIPGQLSVSPTGGVSYQIPIDVPPGVNGLQPQLSIVYNSQGGNGLVGWGWQLGGISSISRTGSTLYHDSKVAAVDLSDSDNLSWDGQRLFLISGNNLSIGSKYRSEVDNFSDITAEYETGFQGFLVKAKSGLTLKYGLRYDAYIPARSREIPLISLLKEMKDGNGNTVSYFYSIGSSLDSYSYIPYRIVYNGALMSGLETSSTGKVKIDLLYEERPDMEISYIGGVKIIQNRRLKAIECRLDDRLVCRYNLTYSFDGLYSRLQNISLENSDSEKLPATIIDQEKMDTYSKYSSDDWAYFTNNPLESRPLFADFNGDGRRDFITVKDRRIQLYLNNDYYGSSVFLKKCEYYIYGENYKGIAIADLNGDGLMDLIPIVHAYHKDQYSEYSTYRYNYLFFDGNQFSSQTTGYNGFNTDPIDNNYLIGDFNGDGKHEIMIKSTQRVFDQYGNAIAVGGIPNWGEEILPTFPNNLNVLDITGNGKTNICIRNGNMGYVYELNGQSFALVLSTSELSNYCDIYPGDANGDGKSDIFVIKNNPESQGAVTAYFLYSTGTSFEKKIIPGFSLSPNTMKGFSGDFNLDGKMDFMIAENDNGYFQFKVGINNGSNFIYSTHPSSYALYSRYDWEFLDVADYDGDGRFEVGYNRYIDAWMIRSFSDTFFPQIESINDGLTNNYYFSFESLSKNSVCQNRDNFPVLYPVVKTKMPLYVVRQYVHNQKSYYYTYKDAQIHKQGKGFIGFKQTTVLEHSRNEQTVTDYAYNSYFYPYPTLQTVSTGRGQPISTIAFDHRTLSTGYRRFYPYVYSQTSTDHLSTLSTIVSQSNYDAYGNPQTITTQKGDLTETQTLSYTAAGAWCPNKITSLTVTATQGGHSLSRTSQYEYSPQGNLLREVLDPDDINRKETIYSNFDQSGHARQINVTANGKTLSSSATYSANGLYQLSKTDALG